MNTNEAAILAALMISITPLVSQAGPLECQGDLISPGITKAQLLDACLTRQDTFH